MIELTSDTSVSGSDSCLKPGSINVVYLLCNSDGVFQEEVFPLALGDIGTGKGQIDVAKLNDEIETRHPLDHNQEYLMSYFSTKYRTFVLVGNPKKPNVPHLDIENIGDQLYLKFRIKSVPNVDQEKIAQKSKEDENIYRRTKERKIGDVVQKVLQWRYVYEHPDSDGKTYSLDEAAYKVGMSKKSLDDYLLQIRNARKFGFNFNEHRDEKIGILRAFNKKNKPFLTKGKPGRKPRRRV